jgi:SnoaL-like domain
VSQSNVELVRAGFASAMRGDVAALEAMLAPDVYWGAPGGRDGGCHNRTQAVHWMRAAIDRGVTLRLIDARELADGRVLTVLQRIAPLEGGDGPPPPHAQLVSFRDGQVTEMLFYPTPEGAEAAAGPG